MPARNPKEVIQQTAGNIDVRGRDAIRQTVQQFLALNPTMTVDPSKAIAVGDIALVTGSWTLQGQSADGDMRDVEGICQHRAAPG